PLGLPPGRPPPPPTRLIRPAPAARRSEVLEPRVHRLQRERRVEHRGRVSLVPGHRLIAEQAAAYRLHLVFVLLDALEIEHLVKEDRKCRVDRINRHDLAAEIL